MNKSVSSGRHIVAPRSLGSASTWKQSERGFSLIMIAACSVVMFGMLGLTIDLGRVYISKNELQAFVDASSVAATLQLNGTQAGLVAADAAAASGPVGPTGTYNGWNFDSAKVSTPVVSYSTTYGGTYYPSSSGSVDPASRFVQVKATGNSPLYFLPIIPGIGNTLAVGAVATAGLSSQTSMPGGGSNGAAPFSPDAHNAASPNFGFTKGQLYTMKMAPPGHGGATCRRRGLDRSQSAGGSRLRKFRPGQRQPWNRRRAGQQHHLWLECDDTN